MNLSLRLLIAGTLVSSSLVAATVTDWTFEDGTPGAPITQVQDTSGNGFHSTGILGEPRYSDGPGAGDAVAMFTPPGGIFGSGFRVDEQPAFSLTNDFTLEARFKPGPDTVTGANRTLIQRSDLTTYVWAWGLYYDPDQKKANFGIGDQSGESVLVFADVPDDGQFHHAAGTFKDGVLSLYIDGVLKTNLTTTLRPDPRPKLGICVGAIWNGGYWFTGDISRARVSNRALSATEFFTAESVSPTVADWTFEEGTPGTAITQVHDTSGNAFHSTSILGQPSFSAGPGGGDAVAMFTPPGGIFGSGFMVNEQPAFNLTNEFTLEARFKPGPDPVTGSTRALLQRTDWSVWSYALTYDPDHKQAGVSLGDISTQTVSLVTDVPEDGQFHHAAGTYKDGVLSLYLDGVLKGSTNTALRPDPRPKFGISVGAIWNGGFWFTGDISRVRVSSKALTPAQFFTAESGSPIVGDWTFEDGTSGTQPTSVRDSSGRGNHGTVIHGTPTYVSTHLGDEGKVSLQVNGSELFGSGFTTQESPSLTHAGDFTLEVIARIRSGQAVPRTLIQASSTTDSRWPYTLYYEGDTVGFVLMDAAQSVANIQTPFPSDGASHSVAAVKAGNEMRLYVDGVLKTNLTTTLRANFQPAQRVSIGANDIGGYWLDGVLDRVRIANKALAPGEFLASPLFFDGLPVAWWRQYFGDQFASNPDARASADPDADGSSNQVEFLKGTDPKNALSGFRSGIKFAPVISWTSVAGVPYQVFKRATPQSPAAAVSPVIVAVSDNSVFVDLQGDDSTAFYFVEPAMP